MTYLNEADHKNCEKLAKPVRNKIETRISEQQMYKYSININLSIHLIPYSTLETFPAEMFLRWLKCITIRSR